MVTRLVTASPTWPLFLIKLSFVNTQLSMTHVQYYAQPTSLLAVLSSAPPHHIIRCTDTIFLFTAQKPGMEDNLH